MELEVTAYTRGPTYSTLSETPNDLLNMPGQRTLLHALHVFRSFSLLEDEDASSRPRAPRHTREAVSLPTDRQVVECAREAAMRAIPTLVEMLKVSLSPGHPQLTDDVVAALLACIRNATKGR